MCDSAVSSGDTTKAETSPSNTGGFVSNRSLEENELEEFCAPEYALEEEKKLREEREKKELREEKKQQDASKDASQQDTLLEKNKYAQLDRLLDQSKLYTQFLSEQMNIAQESTLQSAEKEATKKNGAASKKKKKAGPTLEETAKEICPGFSGSLRDYQLNGVQCLISL